MESKKTPGKIADDGGFADVARARDKYASEWSQNAAKFARDGHYDWMSGFVCEAGVVLEIGLGDGSSTSALLARALAVVGVDENAACLERAEARLRADGRSVTRAKPGIASNELKSPGTDSGVWPVEPVAGSALLICGDLLDDTVLTAWLRQGSRFGAVVCWLMGTYAERSRHDIVRRLSVRSPDQYRLVVQDRILGLARAVLRPGGIVHFVDRCVLVSDDLDVPPGSPRWLARARDAYAALGAPWGFEVHAIAVREYAEPGNENGTAVGLTRSQLGHDPMVARTAFISVVLCAADAVGAAECGTSAAR